MVHKKPKIEKSVQKMISIKKKTLLEYLKFCKMRELKFSQLLTIAISHYIETYIQDYKDTQSELNEIDINNLY